MSASLSAMRGGQPSTTQPIAGPWLSPKVVTLNMWPNVLNDIVCDLVRQWRGSTLNGLEHGVPGLVTCAYHRVKCVRARSMTRSVAFLHRGIHGQEKICINLLLAQNRANDPSTFR